MCVCLCVCVHVYECMHDCVSMLALYLNCAGGHGQGVHV